MSLLCYSRAAEEPHSMGCKEDGVKAQRQGLDNWKCWLGPLVCLQHRLQMTASSHLTDALWWLQSIPYCTSLYITARAVVSPAWSNQPWLQLSPPVSPLCFFKPLPSPGEKKKKQTQTNHKPNKTQSAVHHKLNWFQHKV